VHEQSAIPGVVTWLCIAQKQEAQLLHRNCLTLPVNWKSQITRNAWQSL